MTPTLNPLAAMFEGAAVLVSRDHAAQFESCLAQAAQHPRLSEMLSEPLSMGDDGFWPASDDWRASMRPYIVQNGILMIPVRGILLHNFPWQMGNWATGYDYIWRAYERGMDDANVRGIAFVIHSPGGLVAGNQVLVDRMYLRRTEKPVRAFAQEGAYSAAYNVFSVAKQGVVSPTGGVGSIGVMTAHVDWSKFNEQMGVKYTFIFAGAHKVDGNPEEPLSDDAKARIQERIDELYDVFVSSVARNRGLDEQAVRNTEALCFSAKKALESGLADAIGSLDEALAAFAANPDADCGADDDDPDNDDGDSEMTQPSSAVDQAALDTAVAAARTDAITAERTRIGAILSHAEAEGRADLASHLAFESEMSADAAVAMLAKAPKSAPAAPPAPAADAAANAFNEAMGKTLNPDVGGGGIDEPNAVAADGSDTIALARRLGLSGVRQPKK